jgi:hypothetical protein
LRATSVDPNGVVRALHCVACHRWSSGPYAEVFAAEPRRRARPRALDDPELRDRRDRWLSAIEQQDPYRKLGLSPLDSAETVKRRYRQLALENHPDRGGSQEAMAEVNLAYEMITRHLQRREEEELPPAVTPCEVEPERPTENR